MSEQSIYDEVVGCIGEIVPSVGIHKGSLLKKDLGLDSLSLVNVIVMLEDKFEIVFDDAELDPSLLVTVQNLVSIVKRYV